MGSERSGTGAEAGGLALERLPAPPGPSPPLAWTKLQESKPRFSLLTPHLPEGVSGAPFTAPHPPARAPHLGGGDPQFRGPKQSVTVLEAGQDAQT